jgi:guanylate kinase
MKNNKPKSRIVLCGKAASGKDYLRKILDGRGYQYGISYTTRPAREGEVDGRDYYFLEESEFLCLIDEGFFYEYISFNGWMYGTSKDQWYTYDDVFIMTPVGISHIKPEDRKNTFIIYLDIPIEIRGERLRNRNMPGDSLERRIEADEKDFENFTDFDMKITDPKF